MSNHCNDNINANKLLYPTYCTYHINFRVDQLNFVKAEKNFFKRFYKHFAGFLTKNSCDNKFVSEETYTTLVCMILLSFFMSESQHSLCKLGSPVESLSTWKDVNSHSRNLDS